MPLSGTPLKVKLIGFAVLAIMVLSVVGLSLEAVNQSMEDSNAAAQASTQQPVTGADAAVDADDTATLQTLKFVCPFH